MALLKRLLRDLTKPVRSPGTEEARLRALYLDLIQECLLGRIYEDPAQDAKRAGRYDRDAREQGVDWPSRAHTMIGARRMTNLRQLVEQVIASRVPGDFIETGVWRGGACIYVKAILVAHRDRTRCVWVADSFQGLPRPDVEKYPADAVDNLWQYPELAVSLEEVRSNFDRYGLLDERIRFLKGWFRDTLPEAPIERLALMRLDGDMYESTMDSLESLYDKLSPGGFVIVDDYALERCKLAVHDFRARRAIQDPIVPIDITGVFWQKAG